MPTEANLLKSVFNVFDVTFRYEFFTIGSVLSDLLNNTGDSRTDLFKKVDFYVFIIIALFTATGLLATNFYVRGIALPIPGGMLLYEFIFVIIYRFKGFELNQSGNAGDLETFFKIFGENFKEFSLDEDNYPQPPSIITILDIDSLQNSTRRYADYAIYCTFIFIFALSNRLVSIDRTLVFLALAVISFKLSFKGVIDQELFIFKLQDKDIYYLITCAVLFILSCFVKLVRDILVNFISAAFYSIFLSLIIVSFYYRQNPAEAIERIFKEGKDSNESFIPYLIFFGCFIGYLLFIFITWKLFWKKKTIVKQQ
ncbi:hypothetical protein HERIO_676 [Hepatospora eriocheir]|uniref:Uncharacterized protein n=1 Tax=Hepatospora eriocheir TaxID=1081669 RepID=A0A1X0QCN0_9MICR|nr:hypothetical protein HERIO_676 [Hepatospora eriocheir]